MILWCEFYACQMNKNGMEATAVTNPQRCR